MSRKTKFKLAILGFMVSLLLLASILIYDHKMTPRNLKHELDYYRPDDVAEFVHQPGVGYRVEWGEHPEGGFEKRTNNLGFREDEDTKEVAQKLRVLLTGDSHTDGVVNNRENMAQVIEKIQAERGKEVEVINAGCGYYGPQNYLGLLKKFLYLKPKKFVVVAYMGNDFMESIQFSDRHYQSFSPFKWPSYYSRLESANFSGMSQGFNQLYFFQHLPGQMEVAQLHFRESLSQIIELCRGKGIEFYLFLLPAAFDIEVERSRNRIEGVSSKLELSEVSMGINRKMTRSLFEWAVDRVKCMDLYEGMRIEKKRLYWKTDFHLNVEGHRRVGELISEFIF